MVNENKYYFQKLTPINNVELKIYEDALSFVFANDDIINIAVSGSYSAGKSSIIDTYKKKFCDIRFLHISLAHFESTHSGDNNSTKRRDSVLDEKKENPNSHSKLVELYNAGSDKGVEAILEGKILNQLIHQIDPDKIPQTHFKVKQKVSDKKIIKSTATITAFLILAGYIGFFNIWCQFVFTLPVEWLKNLLLWTTNSVWLLFSGIICNIILGLAVYTVIKTQKNRNIFRKVSLQGNEIEIFEENDDSYFDKYLNEVLYIFENCGADVIVFEDMDRYNVNQIFEKLREINTLVNNKKKKEKKSPIRFFYLLRDDIFVSKDRTKFFDFIVPIVPVIDSSNSYDKFIEYFKEGGIFELFDENFLQGLSLYIDDLRILKNIYNEFVIYRNRIEFTELNSNKLLAIIAYKNIFPRDFGDLQLGIGFVHTLFENKFDFIKQEINKIEMEIHEIEEKIQLLNSVMLDSLDELDATFLLSNLQIHSIAGINASTFKTRVELVKAMKDNPQNVHYYYNHSIHQIDMLLEFQQLKQNPEYIKRKKLLDSKSDIQLEKLKEEIQTLQIHKAVIQNNRLREIITKDNIDTIFNINFINKIGEEFKFEEIKASPYFPLIKYLIRNGYIDETYPDYMTYFYENSLSRIDKIFLRSVTDEVPKEYAYSLKDPRRVLSKLRVVDFNHVEVLNFDLLCYLLKNEQNKELHLTRFLQQLKDTKNFSFISQFLDTRRESNLFIRSLNQNWLSIWKHILEESDFTDVQKKQYVIDTLFFSSNEDIEALNENNSLTAFISDTHTFLDIDTQNVKKIVDGLILLDVQFAWIDYGMSDKNLFKAVYTNNLYQLTFDLISLMLETIYNLTKSDDFKSKNYTLISSKPNEPLASYINDKINNYIDIVLENCNKIINDEESAALAILNNKNVDDDNKEEYINFLQTVIEHIEKVIDKELWGLLLQHKRVNYSEGNILNYFFLSEKGLDSFLIQFVNSGSGDLHFDDESISNKFGDKAVSKFYSTIITCGELLNEKYEMILALKMIYKSFPYKEIQDEKILILIKIGVIPMTAENLSFIRQNYPNNLIPFIVKNISQYTSDIINKENFELDEMLSVLEGNVADRYKIDLLKYTTDRISVIQKKYSNIVMKYILEHNLDVSDISFLLKGYPRESDGIKELIKHISVQHITEIINHEYSIPFELLTELLNTQKLTAEIKKRLFVLCLPNMNETHAKEYLSLLQMNDFLSLFNRKRPKFEVNDINEKILTIFKKKHWITTFDIDKDEPDYYRANGRKMLRGILAELL